MYYQSPHKISRYISRGYLKFFAVSQHFYLFILRFPEEAWVGDTARDKRWDTGSLGHKRFLANAFPSTPINFRERCMSDILTPPRKQHQNYVEFYPTPDPQPRPPPPPPTYPSPFTPQPCCSLETSNMTAWWQQRISHG
jgi:hypothetical protein